MSRPAVKPRVRAAVYTRKSSEEGLDQEFNSLHAQRASGEAYVASQSAEGWLLVPDRYDDGGISGPTLERPALKRLLADVEAGRIGLRGRLQGRSAQPVAHRLREAGRPVRVPRCAGRPAKE